VLGSTTPRIWTPPLRELTPDTSYGYDVNTFARDVLRHPYDPWQEWLTIHGGELYPDGRPRFRIVLVLVSRQNGKTEVPVVLSAYWQFVEQVPLILGTSTKLDYAKESWMKARKLITRTIRRSDAEAASIRAMIPGRWYREANGEQESWAIELDEHGQPVEDGDQYRYKIGASNAEGGRSLTINRLILDELRQHATYSAYNAAEPACSPMDAQIWALSNAGDESSVVLNDLRAAALEFIETGEGDERLGLFEWSAPQSASPTDTDALAQANPNLGRRLDADALLAKARRAVIAGGEALTGFKTEYMCINVKIMNPAIDPGAWQRCHKPGSLEHARSRLALVVDVSPDQLHAAVYAAAMMDADHVRVDYVESWAGEKCTDELWHALPSLISRIKPQVFGWFPSGPAAAIATRLAARPDRTGWPPRGVTVTEIKGELAAVCMGFAGDVTTERVMHSDDPLLNAQIEGAERLMRGDTWVFSRRGTAQGVKSGLGHVNAVYAAAGAAHLARTLPPPPPKPAIITARRLQAV
jgi:hypothetical protein